MGGWVSGRAGERISKWRVGESVIGCEWVSKCASEWVGGLAGWLAGGFAGGWVG